MAQLGHHAYILHYSDGSNRREVPAAVGGKIRVDREAARMVIESVETTAPFLRVMITTLGEDGARVRSMFYTAGLGAPTEPVDARSPPFPITIFRHESFAIVHASDTAHRLVALDGDGRELLSKEVPENGACSDALPEETRALRLEVADCDIYRLSGYRSKFFLEAVDSGEPALSRHLELPPPARERKSYIVDMPLETGELRYPDSPLVERTLAYKVANANAATSWDDVVLMMDDAYARRFVPRLANRGKRRASPDPLDEPEDLVVAKRPAPSPRRQSSDRPPLPYEPAPFEEQIEELVELPVEPEPAPTAAVFRPPLNPYDIHKYPLQTLRNFLRDNAPDIRGRSTAARAELERTVIGVVDDMRREFLEAATPLVESPPEYEVAAAKPRAGQVLSNRHALIKEFAENRADPSLAEFTARGVRAARPPAACPSCKRPGSEWGLATAMPCGHVSACKNCLAQGKCTAGTACAACGERIGTNLVFRR